MAKKIQSNQEFIRYNNQREIIGLMRKGSYSCTDIAKATGLSNTAAENIVNDLLERKILVLSPITEVGKLGRRPIKYHLNGDLGCVASVNLTDRDLVVCISNTNRQMLYCTKVPNVIYITEEVIEELFKAIREGMAQPLTREKPLLCICIASPGLIDAETGYYRLAPRIENYKNINMAEIFRAEFGCDVLIKKDIVSGLIGEMQFGVLSESKPKNAIFIHFDVTVGLAFLFDGKIYEGNNGYLGELGFFAPDLNEPQKGLNLFVSMTSIFMAIKEKIKKENLAHPLANKDVLDFDEVKLLFISGDEVVEQVIRRCAKSFAVFLLNLNSLLDIQQVIIDGRIVELGDKFLEYVVHYLKKYDNSLCSLNIQYSTLMNRAITLGCISCAIDSQFDKILKS